MIGLYWFEYIVISITVRVYNLNKWSNRILMYAGVTKTIPRYMLHVIVFAVDSRDTTRISIPYQCSRTSRIQIYQNRFFVEFGLPGKSSDEKGRDRPKIKKINS